MAFRQVVGGDILVRIASARQLAVFLGSRPDEGGGRDKPVECGDASFCRADFADDRRSPSFFDLTLSTTSLIHVVSRLENESEKIRCVAQGLYCQIADFDSRREDSLKSPR